MAKGHAGVGVPGSGSLSSPRLTLRPDDLCNVVGDLKTGRGTGPATSLSCREWKLCTGPLIAHTRPLLLTEKEETYLTARIGPEVGRRVWSSIVRARETHFR